MKNLLLSIAAMLAITNVQAEKTILSGHFNREAASTITLQYYANIIDGIESHKTYVETTLDAEKNFTLSFDIERPTRINVLNDKDWLFYNIFICPGDSIYMVFNDSSVTIEGRGESNSLSVLNISRNS